MALVLGLVLGLGSAISRADPGESGAPKTLAIHPAQTALAMGEHLAAFSPDMRSVLGFSSSGVRLWRVGIGDQAGTKDLRQNGPALLAYAGQEVLAISPGTGKVTGRRAASLPDPERPEEGCELTHRGGVCALRCACSFELVHCDTLETVGPKVSLPKLAPVGDASEARCPSYSGALLGRAGDALIASVPIATDTPFFGVAEEALAISATTGEVLWRASRLGRLDPQLSGVSADGTTCFAGSRAGAIQVFDCQRATPRWRRDISIVKAIEPQVFASGELLVVRDGKTLRGLALTDGAQRWAIELPVRTVAWPARAGELSAWSSRPDTLVLLDPSSGRREATLPMPAGMTSSPLRSEQLLVSLGRDDLVAQSASGENLLTTRRRPSQPVQLTAQALLFSTPERVELHTLELPSRTLIRRATFDGPLAKSRPVGLFATPDGLRVVLLRDGKGGWDPSDPSTFGELHFFAL